MIDKDKIEHIDKCATKFFNWLYMEVDAGAKFISEAHSPLDRVIRKHETISSIAMKCNYYMGEIHDGINQTQESQD